MALSVKVGSVALNTTTGSQAVTGVGFQPTALIFFGNDLTADGPSADSVFGIGVGISSSSRASMSQMGEDAQNPTDAARRYHGTACYVLVKEDETDLVVADFTSMDTDGFTLNLTTVSGSANILNYIALGGADLTNAAIKLFNTPTSTGSVGYTGVGFKPDSMLLINSGVSSPSTTGNSGLGSIGWANSGSSEGVIAIRIGATVVTQIDEKKQLTTAILHTTNGGATLQLADLTSFDSDGFTLNWTNVSGARQCIALCLKGGQFKVGSFNQATSTGNSSVTDVGFKPSGVVLMSWNSATSTSLIEDSKLSFGAANSSSERASVWAGDEDNVSPQQSNSVLDQTQIITMYSHADTPTLDAEADFVSNDAGGFTVNWTTADATAREILYFAFGSNAVSNIPTLLFMGVG